MPSNIQSRLFLKSLSTETNHPFEWRCQFILGCYFCQILDKTSRRYGKHHVVELKSFRFSMPCHAMPCPVTWEPLNGKTSFQSHTVEQHKSYWMMLEIWESIHGNKNVPLFAWGTFCECLRVACTKVVTTELMNVSGLWDLNEKKVEELLCLLVCLES